jgi:hypothetical protein
MLIVVSGPDRVGKSTLIQQMSQELHGDALVLHHGPPPQDQENIFDFYRQDIETWQKSNKKVAIFDRAWPCSYILEQHRRRNAGHFEDLIDFEIWLNDVVGAVVHVAQFRPWHWSAGLHVEELREEFPDAAPWFIRDEFIARMQEHRIYTEQLQNFYEDITMFANIQLTKTYSAQQVLAFCKEALRDGGL